MWIKGREFVRFLDLMEEIDELKKKKNGLLVALAGVVLNAGGKIEIPYPSDFVSVTYWTQEDTGNLVITAKSRKKMEGKEDFSPTRQ